VKAGGSGDSPVEFDKEAGEVFLRVQLEPSKTVIRARLSSACAGNGETEYNTFVGGEEVVVILPQGNERAGGVIIGRMNNAIDKFPMESVAGQDPTTNTFSFSRRRTPRLEEFAGPIILRSAISGGLISLDSAGVFTVRTGDRAVFQMSPDAIGIQSASSESEAPELMLQLNVTNKHFTVTVGDAIFNLSASDASPEPNSTIKVGGALTLSTNGNPAAEHAMSIENFINLMQLLIPVINPLVFATPTAADAALATAITSGASSGGWLLAQLTRQALNAALLTQPKKTSQTPGIMSTGLQIG
jgi:phage baseplate assembly protein gpV